MMGKTHSKVAGMRGLLLAVGTYGLLTNIDPVSYTATLVVTSSFAGVLPDIDIASSPINKKFGPIGNLLEKYSGHRKHTHTPFYAIIFSFIIMALAFGANAIYDGGTVSRCLMTLLMTKIFYEVYDSSDILQRIASRVLNTRKRNAKLVVIFIMLIISFIFADAFTDNIIAVGVGLCLGYWSHLLDDLFNPTGLPLFYPYKDFSKRNYYSIAKFRTGEDCGKYLAINVVFSAVLLFVI